MVGLIVGAAVALVLVVARGMVRRRRRRAFVPEDRTGLPSRLRDPETGEVL